MKRAAWHGSSGRNPLAAFQKAVAAARAAIKDVPEALQGRVLRSPQHVAFRQPIVHGTDTALSPSALAVAEDALSRWTTGATKPFSSHDKELRGLLGSLLKPEGGTGFRSSRLGLRYDVDPTSGKSVHVLSRQLSQGLTPERQELEALVATLRKNPALAGWDLDPKAYDNLVGNTSLSLGPTLRRTLASVAEHSGAPLRAGDPKFGPALSSLLLKKDSMSLAQWQAFLREQAKRQAEQLAKQQAKL